MVNDSSLVGGDKTQVIDRSKELQKKIEIITITNVEQKNTINEQLQERLDSYLDRLTKFEKNKRVEKEKPINIDEIKEDDREQQEDHEANQKQGIQVENMEESVLEKK